MIVKMTLDLGKRMETQIKNLKEMFNKELGIWIPKKNSAIVTMKNNLEGTNSRLREAEEQISEVEDRMVELKATERIKIKEWQKLRRV